MQLIKSNPYRILGLLVGATAREQSKHTKNIPKFVEAEDEIPEEYTTNSFQTIGMIQLTKETVETAASKLNLDSDKMNASLFWFYNGNPITDEPAFDALKDADLDQAINIWSKLTSTAEVTQRNASAHSNLGTLYLSQNTDEDVLEKGISLKLKFLESDFIKDFKALATDETYKTTKKELQLIFLNQIQIEIEKNGGITSNKFLEILSKQSFSAKDDFLKAFVQKPIEEIEKKIEESKAKRKLEKSKAISTGRVLIDDTTENLVQLKSVLGVANIKFVAISDKLADEILQCSIDYFNYWQDNDNGTDYFSPTIELAKCAQTMALGTLVKDRVEDNLSTLAEMKERELGQAIKVLQSIKNAYEDACTKIDKQVNDLQYSGSFLGHGETRMRIPNYNVSIDWSKVEEMKRTALNWDKVVELIKEVIPIKNMEKIIKINNSIKIDEFKELVNFVFEKINYTNKQKIAYLGSWKTPPKVAVEKEKTFWTDGSIWFLLGALVILGIVYSIWGWTGIIFVLVVIFWLIGNK